MPRETTVKIPPIPDQTAALDALRVARAKLNHLLAEAQMAHSRSGEALDDAAEARDAVANLINDMEEQAARRRSGFKAIPKPRPPLNRPAAAPIQKPKENPQQTQKPKPAPKVKVTSRRTLQQFAAEVLLWIRNNKMGGSGNPFPLGVAPPDVVAASYQTHRSVKEAGERFWGLLEKNKEAALANARATAKEFPRLTTEQIDEAKKRAHA